ncbi:MAG TPA: hypothetical protein VLV50_06190, partial [Stellaceae bacterium]|nr:hypothetical protein [Stellaceae bacterium]
LSRYEASIERALARASATLDKLQQRRAAMEREAARPTSPSRRSASGPSLSARGGGEGRGEVGEAPLSRQQRRAALRHAEQKTESAERTQFAGREKAAPRSSGGANGSASPS